MSDKQSKALCSLLTIIVVLLFVIVLYRVFQSLEQIEENMQNSVKNVNNTENILNSTLHKFLYDKTVSDTTEKDRKEYKELCEKNKQKYGLGKNTVCEPFVLEEEEKFHGNMIKTLEPFTEDNETDKLQTKIDKIQELLDEIQNKTSMSLKSKGDVFKATVSFKNGVNEKDVSLLLQEYSIEGNPINLFVIPETIGDKYSLMCIETVKTYKKVDIQLSKCKFFDSFDEMKPFLFKLEEVKNNDNKVIGHKIHPFIDNNNQYVLVVEQDNKDDHTVKLVKKNALSDSNNTTIQSDFQLTKV